MKSLLSLAAFFLAFGLQAQWHPFINDFKVTTGDRAMLDIGLICHLENPEFNQVYLGEKTVVIPAEINGEELELEVNRFRVLVIDTLFQNGQSGLLLFLSYDRETKSTTDDLVVQQVFFPLSAKTLELVGALNREGE